MRIGIHQPNYIPWPGFFYKMAICDVFVLLDNVRHSKSSVTHRNKIKSLQGSEILLTIPLANKEDIINNLQISGNDWRRKHWNCIRSNYSKSPYWEMYYSELEFIYNKEWIKLVDLNIELINFIRKAMGINTKIVLASQIDFKYENKNDLNISICKHCGGTVYVSGYGAKFYNNEEQYSINNIKLEYYNFKYPNYQQLGNNFIENLSIIDLLFNCGPESFGLLIDLV